MATGLGEFFISILVDSAKGELSIQGLVKQMGALEVASVGELAILAALADRIVEVSKQTMFASESLTDYAAATGGSTLALQEWEAVAEHVGIKSETVVSAFGAISSSIEGLKHFGKNSELANLLHPLHMSLEKYKSSKPEQLLEDIRNNVYFQQMDAATKQYVLAQAGLSGLLRVLTRGENGVTDAQFKEWSTIGGSISDKQRKDYDRMYSDLTSVAQLAFRIGRIVAGWFSSPTIKYLEDEIEALKVIATGLGKLAGWREALAMEKGGLAEYARDFIGGLKDDPITRLLKNSDFAHPERGAAPDLFPFSPALHPPVREIHMTVNNHMDQKFNASKMGPEEHKRTTKEAVNEMMDAVLAQLYVGHSQ